MNLQKTLAAVLTFGMLISSSQTFALALSIPKQIRLTKDFDFNKLTESAEKASLRCDQLQKKADFCSQKAMAASTFSEAEPYLKEALIAMEEALSEARTITNLIESGFDAFPIYQFEDANKEHAEEQKRNLSMRFRKIDLIYFLQAALKTFHAVTMAGKTTLSVAQIKNHWNTQDLDEANAEMEIGVERAASFKSRLLLGVELMNNTPNW